MTDNIIKNGYFNEGSYNYTNDRQVLTGNGELNEWTLLSWALHPHSVQFLSNHSTRAPALPDGLRSIKPGFAGLNAGYSGLIYQCFELDKPGAWELTWYAAVDKSSICQNTTYLHSAQVGQGRLTPSTVDNVNDGFFHEDHYVVNDSQWHKYSKSFNTTQSGLHYVSFLGDKTGNDCGVIITGVAIRQKITTEQLSVTVDGGEIKLPVNGSNESSLRFVVQNRDGVIGDLPDIVLSIKNGVAEAHFIGDQPQMTVSTNDKGIFFLPSESLFAGPHPGDATLYVKLLGESRSIPIKVESSTAEKIVLITPTLQTPPGMPFDGTLQVQVQRILNGRYSSSVVPAGVPVTFTIKGDDKGTSPHFRQSDAGQPKLTSTKATPEGGGVVKSDPIVAGAKPGIYDVIIATPSTHITAYLEVRGVASFYPQSENHRAVVRQTVHDRWSVRAQYADKTGADRQLVDFFIIDNDDTASLFANRTTSTSDESGTDGKVQVPSITIGPHPGTFTITIEAGDAQATMNIEVIDRQIPQHIEFIGLPDMTTLSAKDTLKGIRAHVTSSGHVDMISGKVTFVIADLDNTGTRFEDDSIAISKEISNEDGIAEAPPIKLGHSGRFILSAAFPELEDSAKTTFVIK